MNRNSEVPLVAADAFVMYYDNMLGKWVASGASKSVTVAKVQLLQNLTTNQFRIFAYNPISKEILVSSILYYNLRYQKAHATFHEWRDADTQLVYGLHFADAKEALIFGDIISKVFLSLESIYHQCRELHAVIRANAPQDQYSTKQINLTSDSQPNFKANLPSKESHCDIRSNEFSPTYLITNPPNQKSNCASHSKINSLTQMNKHSMSVDSQDLPNYENINNIFMKQSDVKSLPGGSETFEFRCQSSSDDSVRGLKRQPSSASSGYATVASIADQYSPTPGLTSSFSMVAEALNKTICDSKNQCQNVELPNPSLHEHITQNAVDVVQSSFASQLQSIIQLRRQNQNSGSTRIDPSGNFIIRSDHKSESTSCELRNDSRDSHSASDSRTTVNSKIKPVDDIMSEMKMKLQRRKQLIDGHTDPNYSSSTEKSDVCSSSASDAGSFIEDKSNNLIDEMRDVPSNMINLKKRSTGDIMQMSSSSAVLASKDDLDRIKIEISNDFRRELLEVKKEVVDAIRLHPNISS